MVWSYSATIGWLFNDRISACSYSFANSSWSSTRTLGETASTSLLYVRDLVLKQQHVYTFLTIATRVVGTITAFANSRVAPPSAAALHRGSNAPTIMFSVVDLSCMSLLYLVDTLWNLLVIHDVLFIVIVKCYIYRKGHVNFFNFIEPSSRLASFAEPACWASPCPEGLGLACLTYEPGRARAEPRASCPPLAEEQHCFTFSNSAHTDPPWGSNLSSIYGQIGSWCNLWAFFSNTT